ncbi:acyltransferase family protein [Paenarthrobacter nitroguajacolicus]|uniref:acyltransferase family protein n=1 Tax=Paenarthrobacter nitroguajacolicus TaxID=211146 RepID=UPI004054733D
MLKNTAPFHDDTRLPALTGLRFLAALAVMVSHFDHRALISVPDAVISFLDGGRTAVSLFFVLSGFILAYNYSNLSGRTGRVKFYANRVARIYPVTLLALALGALGVAYAIANPASGALMDWYALEEPNAVNIGGSFIAQITVLTGWLPTASLNQPWNSPAWSISCEFFFYALFPFLIVAMKRLTPARVTLVLLGAFVFQCVTIWGARAYAPAGQKGFLVSQFPLTHLFEFVIGIAAALFFLRGGAGWIGRGFNRALLLSASLIPLALIAFFRPVDPAYLLMSPLFAVLILALGVPPKKRASILAWGPLVLLGEASFSLYMIHVPLMNLYSIANTPAWVGWLLFAVTVGLSIAVFKWFETPSRSRVRTMILKLWPAGSSGKHLDRSHA